MKKLLHLLWIALGLCIGAGIGSVLSDNKSKP